MWERKRENETKTKETETDRLKREERKDEKSEREKLGFSRERSLFFGFSRSSLEKKKTSFMVVFVSNHSFRNLRKTPHTLAVKQRGRSYLREREREREKVLVKPNSNKETLLTYL